MISNKARSRRRCGLHWGRCIEHELSSYDQSIEEARVVFERDLRSLLEARHYELRAALAA